MAANPLVCAVMLTRDRPLMARRAVESFLSQTYANKRLVIVSNGAEDLFLREVDREDPRITYAVLDEAALYQRKRATIGTLRNVANAVPEKCDIFVTFDDDDVSHANRIAEQVALLQASGKECVGYRECLFWKDSACSHCGGTNQVVDRGRRIACSLCSDGIRGEAWLYRNADPRRALGASLCYWREVWQKRPFPDMPKGRNATGEDHRWLEGVDSLGITAMDNGTFMRDLAEKQPAPDAFEPRMVCGIHAGNSTDYDPDGLVRNGSPNWKRVPEWDDYARKVCAL